MNEKLSESLQLVLCLYRRIFQLRGESFKLLGVKRTGESKIPPFGNVHKFLVILEANADIDEYEPSANDIVVIKNHTSQKWNDLPCPHLLYSVKRKIKEGEEEEKKEDGEEKKRVFDFMVEINPATVLDFYVKNGKYRIKCEGQGIWS